MLLIFISESPQKVAELTTDKCDHFWLLDPGRQVFLIVSVVIVVAYVFLQFILHLSLAHQRHILLGVLAIRHLVESCSLAGLSSLHSATLLIVLTFSLFTALCINHFLILVIDTTVVRVSVKVRSFLVISKQGFSCETR